MKRFSILMLVSIFVVAISGAAMAQDLSLSVGAWYPTLKAEDSAAGAVSGEDWGYSIRGTAGFGNVGLTGFYGYADIAEPEKDEVVTPDATFKASAFYALAGYDFGPITVGGGWASLIHKLSGPQSEVVEEESQARGLEEEPYAYETTKWSASGLALGAFTDLQVAEKVGVHGAVLYVPDADITRNKVDEEGRMCGVDVGLSYQLTDVFGVEGGYQHFKLVADDEYATDETSMGGFYLGAKARF